MSYQPAAFRPLQSREALLTAGALAGAVAVATAAAVALGTAALGLPIAIAAAWFLVRYPLALYTGFLFIGIFKREAFVQALPGDATLLLAALLSAVCFWRFLRGERRPLPPGLMGLMLLIGGLLALSTLWTPIEGYGTDKALRFATLTTLAVLAPFFLLRDRRDVHQLLGWLAFWGVLTAVAAITGPSSVGLYGRLGVGSGEDQNTIFASRALCTAALVLIFLPSIRPTPVTRIAAPLGAVAVLAVAVAVGSRGPVLGLGIALAATTLPQLFGDFQRVLTVVVAVLAGVVAFQFLPLPAESTKRIASSASDPLGTFQGEGRVALYDEAIRMTGQSPLRGNGSGSFAENSAIVSFDEQRYPHNIFLELSSELGVFPAVALAVAILWLIVRLMRRATLTPDPRDRRLLYLVLALFLATFFATQFSGDVNDNRTFFAFLALAWTFMWSGVPPDRSVAPLSSARPLRA